MVAPPRPLLAVTLVFASLSCGGSRAPQSSSPAQPLATAPAAVTAPAALAPAAPASASRYPAAKRGDVVDDFHGTAVADPYRWLEDADSAETREWVEAQNKLTFGYLESIPARAAIAERLETLWDYEKYGIPYEKGGRYFYTKNDGLQPQSVLYWAPSLDAEPQVLIDPNTWSADGTEALGGSKVSKDGKYIAYGIQRSGSDWREWRVKEIATGQDLDDRLRWIKFSRATWSHDNRGFYYSRYPESKDGESLTAANFNQSVYYHRLGSAQADDQLVYETPDKPKHFHGVTVTEDGRYLVLTTSKGTGNVRLVRFRDLRRKSAEFSPIVGEFTNEFRFLGNEGPRFYFFTDTDAPRGRVIAIDVRRPAPKRWKEIIGQSEDTLSSASIVGDQIFARYMHHARSRIRVFNLRGRPIRDVALPGLGRAGGFYGERKDRETFYYYTDYTTPVAMFRYDLRTGKSTLFRKPEVKFDGGDYATTQVFYASKDGTKIPMFLVHKKDAPMDGSHPTLLYGYGGFNIPLMPEFSVSRAVWLEMGGVVAVANLRGGGEYGEEWHAAGTKLVKQNVFDDFIGAAEWLIANKWTTADKLAIQGGSNGGLLVGAAITQRPELFGAALPATGVMDMLRYHTFTIGWAWIDDYGSADDPAEFKALRAYSPVHNVTAGTAYPPTLVTTADHDDRVVPSHSFKFTAAMQHAQSGDNPILIRIATKAGHGSGKPTKMKILEAADEWAFLVKTLGMKVEL